MDSPADISVEHISKKFEQGGDTLHILRDVNFEARAGNLIMIVGPSGSGKTTLLSAIAGTLKVDAGKIRIFDFVLNDKKNHEVTAFRRSHIGFIFQQFHLIPTLTCVENVSVPLLLNGWDHEKGLKQAYQSLEEVGLGSKANTYPKLLSGGQQQRVAIVRALIHKPKLIICDEPTSALDAESGSKIMELISSHSKMEGRVVIVVTHDSRIFKYATQIVRMDDGRITS